ncbi:hypothetical protein [Kitasatospora sp. NPDC001175]|uniref:hypothetical protein n=1 Tax=Kitasatospora sp. NPDC001175 TaxID=3157103 RepID=UPI003D04B4C4
MVAGGLAGCALLGGLLATCGPSGGHTDALVTAPVSGSPSLEGTSVLRSAAPRTSSASPSASPTPSAAPVESPSADVATAEDHSDAQPEQPRTPRQHSRPRPAAPHRHDSHAGSPPTAPTGLFPSLRVCAEAERLGQWAPGSEQARICRGLYGN